MSEPFRYPESGMPLPEARTAIDAMRGRRFANRATGIVAQLSSSAKGKLVSNKATGKSKTNGKRFAQEVFLGTRKAVAWMTIKESRQHGHHIYSVEAIKVEALDRKVEVVSGNTPHASSASTGNKIASSEKAVKWALEISWIAGTILLAFGLGNIVVNIHETSESLKYRALFWGLIKILLGLLFVYIGLLKRKGSKGAQ